MINYKELIEANPAGVLATQNGEKVATRYVSCLFVEENRAYFWSDAEKPMVKQMEQNPSVSFCISPKNYNPVLSIGGTAIFVEDRALKTRIWEENRTSQNMYNSPDNPRFKVFYINIEAVEVYIPGEGTSRYQIKSETLGV